MVRHAGAGGDHTEGVSAIRWAAGGYGDTAASILERVIAKMRWDNDKTRRPSRQLSLAITNAEQALHWLREL